MSAPNQTTTHPIDANHQLPAPGDPNVSHHDDHGHDDHGHGEGIPHDLPKPGAGTVFTVLGLFVLLLAGLFIAGIVPAHREEQRTRADAVKRSQAKPVAQWVHPIESVGDKDVTLPCDVTAYQQTAIYTRTNGYLKEWHYDIGQHVEKGALMAVIETPEVDAELAQSKATLQQNEANVVKANADLELARVTLQRYIDAQKTSPGSVTQEDVDTHKSQYDDAVAGLKQVEASVTQAKANVQQLQTTVDFEKVYAPFSGTVTARNYDVGALLSPTTTGVGQEIFDLAETDKLRVFVNVPQGYANNIKSGQKAFLKVRNFAERKFTGVVSLTAGAIDPNTRTLRVQIDFDNKDGALFAGAYGQILLPVTPQTPVSIIHSSSLIFNSEGTKVATLGEGDKIHIKNITVGRDLGTELEVTSGLTKDDRVIINPGERTVEGAEMEARQAPSDDAASPAPAPKPAATGGDNQPAAPANGASTGH